MAGLIFGLLPWDGLVDQRRQLADVGTQGRTFLQDVASRAGGQFVFGEDAHLFKSEYYDEVVDTGDTVDVIANSRYYGEDFTRSYLSYVNTLLSDPPPFIIAAMLDPGNLVWHHDSAPHRAAEEILYPRAARSCESDRGRGRRDSAVPKKG